MTHDSPRRTDAAAVATVTLLPPVARFSLRLAPADAGRAAGALGQALPERIGGRVAAEGVEALCLGPDEWAIQAPEATAERLRQAFAAIHAECPHSLTDISDREQTLLLEGPAAAELLTLGCPRDIAAIAAGSGRRTVFDGVTVVLWRDGADRFRLDVWRSFLPHLRTLLDLGCTELAAG